MFKIVDKEVLNPVVERVTFEAPLVAAKCEPGQFVILRVDEDGERIPLTVSDWDREKGYVSVCYQPVGATTEALKHKKVGDSIADFVGPLGRPTNTDAKKVCVIGGGVGCAIALPVCKKFHAKGADVTAIIGFRSKDIVFKEDEFEANTTKLIRTSDDGTWGEKGVVTAPLERMLEEGERFDEVIAIGPLIMMKFVCLTTKKYDQKTIVSMNPIMIDGTGMCGGCRLTVGGETKFACVDGPEFDGHLIDFDEVMARAATYQDWEKKKHEETCNLFKKEA